jgi:hypothetical protein
MPFRVLPMLVSRTPRGLIVLVDGIGAYLKEEAGAVDRINLQAATGLDDTPRKSDASRRKDAICGLFTNSDTHQQIDRSTTIWRSTLV